MNYTILANSSSGKDFYNITVKTNNGVLAISCNCMAGEMGTMCKHRVAVLTGKYGKIIDTAHPANVDLQVATKLIATHGIADRYFALSKELEDLQKKFKSEERAIKRQINNLVG